MSVHSLNILHVEDDQVDRMVIQRVIKKLGIAEQVTQASNGEEALQILRGGHSTTTIGALPHLVLLDINMPKMNGLEFLKELRADPQLRHISVFMMTTSNDDGDRTEAYHYNVAGYIVKPVDIQQFESTFQTLGGFWRINEWI